ncbi:hypothetical protein [Paenibacillus sp. TH7-28]
MSKYIKYETLLNFQGDDFEVYESSDMINGRQYHLSIEGYIGVKKLSDLIDLYKDFSNLFYKFLRDKNYPEEEIKQWNTIYSSREIQICYEGNCYWVFLKEYKSSYIWNLYLYLQDIIVQLEDVNKKIKHANV